MISYLITLSCRDAIGRRFITGGSRGLGYEIVLAFAKAGADVMIADPEELDPYWGKAIPLPKRMGRAEEYTPLAQQIAENVYLNGETIRLDGALRFTPKGGH